MSEPVVVNLRFLARDLGLPLEKLQPTVELLDEGHPVPFIARYRKDQTGNLDEEQIRSVQAELQTQRTLAERKQTILRSIESQGKLTPELDAKIREAKTTKRLEDLYLPYKPKKQTLASLARERGLEELATEILASDSPVADLDRRAGDFVNPDKGLATAADALLGAGHIISEVFSERVELRHRTRDIAHRTMVLVSKKVESKKDAEKDSPAARDSVKSTRKDKEKKEQPESEKPENAETVVETTTAPPENAASVETPNAENTENSQENAEISVPEMQPVEEPIPDSVPSQDPSETLEEDHAGAGGGEIQEDSSSPESEPAANPEPAQSAEAESKEAGDPDAAPPETESVNEETAKDEIGEKTPESGDPPATEDVKDVKPGESEEITRDFQQWKDRQKEKEQPVVRSQNQLRKKRNAERKKEKAAKQQKQREHLERLFHDYFDFTSETRKLPPHRVLAINRGEKAKVLRIKFESDQAQMENAAKQICVPEGHPHGDYLFGCTRDAIQRLILPTLEREIRSDLTDHAEQHAVKVFAKNLRNLLLQPPLHRKKVLALDPGFKHGCKMVALDEFGNVLDHETVYLTASAEKKANAEKKIVDLIRKYRIPIIAIGNGTACRETEDFISRIIANHFTVQDPENPPEFTDVSYVIVNEAGASVYSASPLAKEEFPEYDILLRGAISIGRRLQDPLNELVKVEPVSLGVGMYQHDLKAKHLRDALNAVVESCVNFVGVDLNTATPPILRYVSGLNQLTAKRIYEYRLEHGPFKSREDLKKVSGLGEVAFTHCAGFLRIAEGSNPLDSTWIHPEMYEVASKILEQLGFSAEDLRNGEKVKEIAEKTRTADSTVLAETLGVGPLTVSDILSQLAKTSRDPREELPPPIFKKGVLKMEDLTPGMELSGTILNVVDFGAFVDIGLHDSGLIHISQMAGQYVRDAHDHVSVGDIVRVWVVDVDPNRKRISLTMIPPGTPKNFEPRQDRGPRPRRMRDGEGVWGENREQGSGEKGPNSSPPRSSDRGGRGERSGDRERGGHRGADRRGPGDSRPPRGPGSDRGGQAPQRDSGGGRERSDRKDRGDWKGDRGKGGRSGRYDEKPKTYSFGQQKNVAPISEEMKKGKEPLRSFGDLAQLFGRVQVEDPEEVRRKKKEEKKQKRSEEKKSAPPSPEQSDV